jgi:hypothetical protein
VRPRKSLVAPAVGLGWVRALFPLQHFPAELRGLPTRTAVACSATKLGKAEMLKKSQAIGAALKIGIEVVRRALAGLHPVRSPERSVRTSSKAQCPQPTARLARPSKVTLKAKRIHKPLATRPRLFDSEAVVVLT